MAPEGYELLGKATTIDEVSKLMNKVKKVIKKNKCVSLQEMIVLREKLIASGWSHIASVTREVPGDKNYGMLFTKNGAKFYLNVETCHALPADNPNPTAKFLYKFAVVLSNTQVEQELYILHNKVYSIVPGSGSEPVVKLIGDI